ncbi:MAG: hypothetical protein AVO34_01580 [Firmicutes bacterium ML8_F2]|nr:MAG: hypothetical protein AVO34_01580 [Firmicutes bacterium ML8_F2]
MKQFLDAIEFFPGDHWLMIAFAPVSASSWPLKPAIIKRVIKCAIESAPSKFFQAPLVNCNLVDTRRSVASAQNQIKHFTDHREHLFVYLNGFESFFFIRCV